MWNLFRRTAKYRATARRVYLDYAGATPVLPEAVRAIAQVQPLYGNPGAIHAEGVAAAKHLARSRERIAALFGGKAREFVFTSGGTEGNNLAILGYARAIEQERSRSNLDYRGSDYIGLPSVSAAALSGTHWIVSSIEHPSVLECFAEIERRGGAVDFVDPDTNGVVRPEAVARLLRSETVFVSVGWCNGEIGTRAPLARIARVVRDHESKHGTTIVFHSDAGQAPLYDAAHVHSLGVDLLTLDSGKLYGPRGVGALYIAPRVTLAPLLFGGKQERGLRPGTENVALAAGFATALTVIAAERTRESRRLSDLQRLFVQELLVRFPQALINGDLDTMLPHIVNVSLPAIDSEYLVLALDHAGFALSTKSACREGEEQQSHVVAALGGDEWRSRTTLRFSFGRDTTKRDLIELLDAITRLVR